MIKKIKKKNQKLGGGCVPAHDSGVTATADILEFSQGMVSLPVPLGSGGCPAVSEVVAVAVKPHTAGGLLTPVYNNVL